MIEKIIDATLRARFLVIAAVLLLIAVGIGAVRTTPLDAIPDLSDVQVIVFTDFPGDAFRFTSGELRYYRSSKIATRGFYPECGTPIAFQYDGSSGPAIMLGTLDHPEDWPPTWEHSGIESKVPWHTISDDLPQTTTEESEFMIKARERKERSLS
jgi:hypothetical protein